MSATPRGLTAWFACLFVAGSLIGIVHAQDPADNPPPPPQPAGQEVQTRGPVHESFAQPVVYDPKPGPVIPKEPPQPIEEMPPDQKPEGANVQWIPGYWAWDDTRKDYLWICGRLAEHPARPAVEPGLLARGRRRRAVGPRAPGRRPRRSRRNTYPTPPASIEAGPQLADAAAGLGLVARLLDVDGHPLRLAARVLGPAPAELDLGPRPVRLDPRRLHVRRGLLGPPARHPRRDVRAGLFPPARLPPAGVRLPADDHHRRGRPDGQPVRPAELRRLLLRRLLRGRATSASASTPGSRSTRAGSATTRCSPTTR